MLHLLTGPWGLGKTSLIPHLRPMLPEAVVFDWDVLLPGLSAAAGTDAHTDPSTWQGLRMMWIAIVQSVLAGGHDVVLCGPARPADFAGSAIAAGSIRCAYLDCPDDVLATRLRARGETDPDIADELSTLAALRASDYPSPPAGGRRTSSRRTSPHGSARPPVLRARRNDTDSADSVCIQASKRRFTRRDAEKWRTRRR